MGSDHGRRGPVAGCDDERDPATAGVIDGQPSAFIFGSLLQRMLYHYWYHTGENMAIRQMLQHVDLPEFVGDIDGEAPYRPEQVSH